MAYIDYLDEEEIVVGDRVADRDNIIQIHGVHSRTMRRHFDLYKELMYHYVEDVGNTKITTPITFGKNCVENILLAEVGLDPGIDCKRVTRWHEVLIVG